MRKSGQIVEIENSRLPNPWAGVSSEDHPVQETGLVWEMDLQGACTVYGSTLGPGFGYVAECPEGKGPAGFMPAEDAKRCLSLLANALAEARPSMDFRHRISRDDGGEFLAACQGTPMHDDAGNLIGYRFVSRSTSQVGIPDDLEGRLTAGPPDGADIETRLYGLLYSLISS